MKLSRVRLAAGVVLVLFVAGMPIANAEVDPFPEIGLGAEIPGTRVSGQIEITCPEGSSRGILVDVSAQKEYTVCNKSWRPATDINADAAFQQAQRDATAAAEAESKAWAEANPGQQKCIQWGPIVHANGDSTSSGGVCANPVPVPAGYVADSSTAGGSDPLISVIESSTPVIAPASIITPTPVNTNGFGGYAVVHPDGHVCGVIVSGSSDPFNNGGIMPQEYMGCPTGSRIVFQSAPSADGNVAGWHGPEVVLSGDTYSLPGGSTINSGIVTDSNGRTWNSGTGVVINPGVMDTRTVTSETATVLNDTSTILAGESLTAMSAAMLISPLLAGADIAAPIDDLDGLPEVLAEEEASTSIEAKIVSGKTRISVASEWASTKLSVVASKKGLKKKYTYKITTNADGDCIFKSSMNLKGFTLVLYKGGQELDRDFI